MDLTNQSAPVPMWQSAQVILLCGERWKATCSGSITVWQTVPQKATVSISLMPLTVAPAMSTVQIMPTSTLTMSTPRVWSLLRSMTGSGRGADSWCARASASILRRRQTPIGISTIPKASTIGSSM